MPDIHELIACKPHSADNPETVQEWLGRASVIPRVEDAHEAEVSSIFSQVFAKFFGRS